MASASGMKDVTQQIILSSGVQVQQSGIPIVTAAASSSGGGAPMTATGRDQNKLREDILQREPVEPARSPKQLYVTEWLAKHKKKKAGDAKAAWKALDKKEKKKWAEKLEPKRQKYIEEYTIFVRGLDKEELELYTQLKTKRDEEEERKRQTESSDSDESESSESESDSDSDSDSD